MKKFSFLVFIRFLVFGGVVVSPSVFSQELLPLQSSAMLFDEVNNLRAHKLTYSIDKQKQVDDYAVSDRLLKHFQHSYGSQGEVIARAQSISGLIDQWRISPPHRKTLKSNKYKSMAARVVNIIDRNGATVYYGVIQFYQ